MLLIVLLPAFSRAVGLLMFYGIFSFLGWALVGLPIALGVSPRLLCRLTWPLRLLIGVALGPMAILIIFVILAVAGGTLKTFSLANTGVIWAMSMLVSATSFVVYTALLRRQVVLR
jgi:hypothetical protein